MKSIIYIKQYLTALVFGLIMSVSCQQIPDLHEMMADIPEVPPQTADRYERLISEVGISLPFSASEIGTMIYQFAYDDNQRVKSIDLFAEYAAGEKYESHITYEYYSDGIQMNTFGTELFTGQLNGYTKYVFYDGILQSSLFRGIENIPDYSFGGINQYSYEEGLLSSVVSYGSGEESLTFTREYEWSNHNIVKEVTSDSQGEEFEISYRYTDYIDKCNLDFLKLAYYLNYYKGLYFTADKVAFRGLSSRNLPAEQVQFTDEETYTFEYEFDDDQYVKKVYIYMDGKIMQIMDIKYTDEETSPVKSMNIIDYGYYHLTYTSGLVESYVEYEMELIFNASMLEEIQNSGCKEYGVYAIAHDESFMVFTPDWSFMTEEKIVFSLKIDKDMFKISRTSGRYHAQTVGSKIGFYTMDQNSQITRLTEEYHPGFEYTLQPKIELLSVEQGELIQNENHVADGYIRYEYVKIIEGALFFDSFTEYCLDDMWTNRTYSDCDENTYTSSYVYPSTEAKTEYLFWSAEVDGVTILPDSSIKFVYDGRGNVDISLSSDVPGTY